MVIFADLTSWGHGKSFSEKKSWGHELNSHPQGPICIGVIYKKTLFITNGEVKIVPLWPFLGEIIFGTPSPCQVKKIVLKAAHFFYAALYRYKIDKFKRRPNLVKMIPLPRQIYVFMPKGRKNILCDFLMIGTTLILGLQLLPRHAALRRRDAVTHKRRLMHK